MRRVAIALALIGALAYLRDPAWVGTMTSGLRPWEEDPPGTRFRWTAGRASFFVPSDATTMILPLRAVFPGPDGAATTVDVRVDDRWLATIALPDPNAWVRTRLPIAMSNARRRYRRVDLKINRVVPPFMLGVMVGEVTSEQRRVQPASRLIPSTAVP